MFIFSGSKNGSSTEPRAAGQSLGSYYKKKPERLVSKKIVERKTPICTKIAQIYNLKIATKLFTTNIPKRFFKKTHVEFALFTWFTFWLFFGVFMAISC